MRLKFGVAIAAAFAVVSSALVGVQPAFAVTYPTSITLGGSTTRTDISDAELAIPSNWNASRQAIQNSHNGIYYYGTDPANSSRLIVRSYKDGALDTGFASGTGQTTFSVPLNPTNRGSMDMATYDNGAKWMILDQDSNANSAVNYLHLGTYAGGYTSTLTLPVGSEFYNNYCQGRPSAGYSQTGGKIALLQESGFSTPVLMLSCYASNTSLATGSSYYDYLVTVQNGTTLGVAGNYSLLSATSLTPLATAGNLSVVLGGYSSWAAATGSQPKMTFFYYRSSSTSPPGAPSAYSSTTWSGLSVTRMSAAFAVSSTPNAWVGATNGSRTGTLMVPTRNNGTIYALAHASDGATSVMNVVTFGQTGTSSSNVTVTGATGAAGPLNRAEIVAPATPSSTLKVALKDGGSGGYWEVNASTAVASAGSTFTSSGIGSIESLYWIPSEDSTGISMYARTSSTNLVRLSFTTAPIAPSTPNAPTATAGDGQVSLSWSAPSNGGAAISDYQIDYSSNSGSTWTTFSDGTSSATSATVTGLTNGTSYVFRIRAVNSAGTSSSSTASASSTPNPVPSQTSGLTVTTNGLSNQLVLSWTAPSGNGSAITDYLIEYSTNGGTNGSTWAHSASTATTATLTGLTNGASYSFRVSAINGIGVGTASSTSTAVTAIALPGAIASAPSATASAGQIALSWSAPSSNGGGSITDYLIEYSTNSGTTWSTYVDGTSTATTATLTGLTTGASYTFRISAINSLGAGTASSTSSAVIAQAATAPSAVGQPTVTPGSNPGDVFLSWTAPAANGSAITDYIIEYSTNGTTWTTFSDGTSTSTSATVTGLTLGTSYSFRVKAVNAIGTASASTATTSTPVVAAPSAIASAPSVVSSPGQVVLTWSAPSSNGGSAITDYLIQYSSDGGNTWSIWSHTASTSTTATITGLTATSNYSFRVAAVNNAGTSSASTVSQTVTALAPTAPGAVATPTSTPGTNPGEVVLTWTAPAANGSAITDYVVQYSPDGGVTWITFNDGTSTSTSATITGLTLGTSYTFRVQAVNSIGSGSASNSSTSLPVITVPGTFASGVSAVASPGQVALTWSAPSSNGGSTITDYLIEYTSNGGTSWSAYAHTASAATSAVVTGLTAGATYSFRVSAVNAAGTGPVSTVAIPVVAQAATAPGAVGQPTATAGANPGEVVLTWTAPAANGSAITDYLIEYSPDGGVTWLTFNDGTSSSTTATITGLTVGTAYVFRVTAINGVGSATAGSTSVAQTPAAVVQAQPTPTTPIVNPRHVPGKINFASQTGGTSVGPTLAGGPVAIEGDNMDMILVVLIGNRSAHVVSQTETRIIVTPAKTVFGYADVTLVYALGSISFPRAVNIVEPGPSKISLNSFWKQKVSERSAKTLLSVWPATGGATSVMCVAKYTKRSNRALALWRASRVCSMLRVNRPDLTYQVAVARKYVKAQLEIRIKY